ncbi:unnamed protein product, partial [Rotaria sp. Silwood2]
NRSLLSIKHFKVDCSYFTDFLKLAPFLPNLISLHLSSENYQHHSNFMIIVPTNCLSKLTSLHMDNVPTFDAIDCVSIMSTIENI